MRDILGAVHVHARLMVISGWVQAGCKMTTAVSDDRSAA